MRTLVRVKIDVTQNPDLSELSAFESVITSIRYKYHNSESSIKRSGKERTKALSVRMKTIEDLKRVLLSKMSSKLKSFKSVTILIDRSYEPVIEDALDSSDFYAYEIEFIKENNDYLISFPTLPIKIKVRRKS